MAQGIRGVEFRLQFREVFGFVLGDLNSNSKHG